MPKETRNPLPPVGWLLGPELVAQLGRILRSPRDPRQWMTPDAGYIHDENRACDGKLVEACPPAPADGAEREVVWFDYISDMGDSGDAMYAIAFACQVDLELDGPLPTSLAEARDVKLWRAPKGEEGRRGNLPRGQFLFFGGDSAYHVADAHTIRLRVQQPFRWASEDVGDAQAPPGRLYGVPSNHDWYDDLQGFSLLFRGGSNPDAIDLPGFERAQVASYTGLQLPHGWQLWGLDVQTGMDDAQRQYFRCLLPPEGEPKRLVLATPTAAVALGRAIAPEPHRQALASLGLTLAWEKPLPQGHCRVDISGDYHHYARYPSPDGSGRYASVVSGQGGAFHHPSFTRAGTRSPVAAYPSVAESRQAVGARLLSAEAVVGSWVPWVSVLMTCLFGASSIQPGGLGWLVTKLYSLVGLGDAAAKMGDPNEVWRLFAMLGAVGAGVVWVAYGFRSFRRMAAGWSGDSPGDPTAAAPTFWGTDFPFAVVIALLFMLWFSFSRFAPTSSTFLDLTAVVLALAAWVGMTAGAVAVGAAYLAERLRKLELGLLGFAHGFIQVTTALLFSRLVAASWLTVGVTVVMWAVTTRLMLPLSRRPFARNRPLWVGGLALLTWAATVAALGLAARGELVPAAPAWWALVRFLAGGFAAAQMCGVYILWYFAIAALLDAHNNEVGSIAKVTQFREIIRFRVDASGLTGYVISVEDDGNSPVKAGGTNLRFRLVDVFVVSDG
jgi:hypothetical protein